jgi:hypothetical protein
MKLLLLQKKIVLKKFSGKGGWTYATIPNVVGKSKYPFGWVMVDAVFDGFEVKDVKIMAMKTGELFLPVRAMIRSKIGKEAGDKVEVKIYANIKLSQ